MYFRKAGPVWVDPLFFNNRKLKMCITFILFGKHKKNPLFKGFFLCLNKICMFKVV